MVDEARRQPVSAFARNRKDPTRRRRTAWAVETLEDRALLTAALAPIANVSVPATLGYQVPLDGSASGASSQTYTVSSSNPDIQASIATGQFVTINVSHTSSGSGDIAFSGAITFQLFQDLTPYTVSQIEQFVTSGFYNGKTFFRVASGFNSPSGALGDIVQGGAANNDGGGNSGQPGVPFPDEFNAQLAFTGTYQVAMANTGPDSNDTQFFFTTASPQSLDFGYTIFAQVVSGQNIIQDMTQVALKADPISGANTYPVNPITITSAALSTTSPDGVVHIDATNAVPGETATITVTATDPSTSTTATQTFTVNAAANAAAPERPFVQTVPPIQGDITAGLNQTIGEGQTDTFRIPGVAPTPGDALTYAVAASYTPPATPGQAGTFNPVPSSEGTATVDANGVVTFTPAAGFSGTVNLLVAVRDNTIHNPRAVSASDPTNFQWHYLTITVNPSTTPQPLIPIALPLSQPVTGSAPTTITLQSQNPNTGATQTLTYTITQNPSHGTITGFDPATGQLTYTANKGFLGYDRFQYTVTASGGSVSNLISLPATVTLSVGAPFKIVGTNPSNGSMVTSLPNGQITITFSEPIAGLVSGGPALSPNDPFGVMLLERGPDLTFSAPSGIDSGNLPLHIDTLYTVNSDGTSTITITPLEPLATDVYLISVNLGSFQDASGNPLTDTNNGYSTFLLQPPPVTSLPLTVTGVTADNGTVVVKNNQIFQPDTLAIHFNKALFEGAAGNGNVLLLEQQPSTGVYTLVPSVATYNPSTFSIYLTPIAYLQRNTTYVIDVSAAVSDDQGFGKAGTPLGQPFYDSFRVANAPLTQGTSPLRAVAGSNGLLATLPNDGTLTNLPLGYTSAPFTESVNMSPGLFGRYSAMLDPRTVGTDGNTPLENVPLNARLAFNPNTDQLIMVPTQATSDGLYVLSLSNMQANQTAAPLLNSAGQIAGVTGPPVYATFYVQAGAQPAVVAETASSTSNTTARPAVAVPHGHARAFHTRVAQAVSKLQGTGIRFGG